MVAEIGKPIWKMQEQFKPKCLTKMTSQYYPTSIFTNYNHVVFEDTLDFSSLHVTITRYQHTQKRIYAVKSAEIIQPVMTKARGEGEGEGRGALFTVHRKVEAIFVFDARCCMLLYALFVLCWSIDFLTRVLNVLSFCASCQGSHREKPKATWLDVTKCIPHKTKSTILQKDRPNYLNQPINYVYRPF